VTAFFKSSIFPPNLPPSLMSTEQTNEEVCCPLVEWRGKLETTIREKPLEAVAAAGLAGLLVQRLPLRSIVVSLVRTTFFLLKPALLLFAVWKVGSALADCCNDQDA